MYLGDSVYVEIENDMLKLTTKNDDKGPSNTIYLDLEIYKNLINFVNNEIAKAG